MDLCLWASAVWTLTALGNLLIGEDPYFPALLAWILWFASDADPIIWDE
jgi:hypothetical protein